MADVAKTPVTVSGAPSVQTTYYTVPASKTFIVRNIHALNYHSATVKVDITFTMGGTTPVTFFSVRVPADSTLDWSGFVALPAGTLIKAFVPGGPSGVVDLLVSGVEVDV